MVYWRRAFIAAKKCRYYCLITFITTIWFDSVIAASLVPSFASQCHFLFFLFFFFLTLTLSFLAILVFRLGILHTLLIALALLGFLLFSLLMVLLGIFHGAVLEQAFDPANDVPHKLRLCLRIRLHLRRSMLLRFHVCIDLQVHDVENIRLQFLLEGTLLPLVERRLDKRMKCGSSLGSRMG